MTDRAYSLLLFSGLVAGPASAFLINAQLLPIYILFPVAALLGSGRNVSARLLLLALAPLLSLGWGLWTSNPDLTGRSLRWLAAVAAGTSMAGALGTSRMSALLHEVSSRTRSHFGVFLDSLSMVLALAGPYSKSVRSEYVHRRSLGSGIGDSFKASLSNLPDTDGEFSGSHTSARCHHYILSSSLAWGLLLSGAAGLP